MTEQSAQPNPPAPKATVVDDALNRLGADRERLFFIFFFAVYFFLIYELFRVLAPFLAPLLGAVMLALVAYPAHLAVARAIKRPGPAAALSTLMVMVTVVVPVTMLVWLVVREAGAAVPALREWLAAQRELGAAISQDGLPASLDRLWAGANRLAEAMELDLRAIALETVRDLGNRVTTFGAAMVREFFAVLFQIVILLFALFFFLRDGPRMVRAVMDLVPMEEDNKQLILAGLDRTLVAMVRGTLITATAQGTLTGVGLAIFGIPFPVLLGFVATFLAVVPFVGAALVWAPAAIYLLASGSTGAALGLTAWGLVVVGLVDNVLRPMVVGEHAKLPITLLFLGVLGGFQVYGLIGGLISPLLIACVFAFARIYRERYLDRPAAAPAVSD
ncbi:MAG: AI-2E family transporter [Rhodospirillaceae bacterium]|nr:AI-2E family transporter [Rhodospirillaceae bacterium]